MLDRFYDLLTERTGIPRTTDMRLEFAARYRAQEAVRQVGYDSGPIPHPPQDERLARLGWSGVGTAELATWNYLYRDPVQAAVDGLMNSTAHREVLLGQRGDFPYWGAGIYRTFKPGDDTSNPLLERWYFLIWLATGVPPVKAIVVNATSSADALVGSYLSAKYAAPILYVNRTNIPVATHDRLVELDPDEILVIGGTAVVGASVATALTAIAPVKRIAGADRFATSVEVSRA